MKYYYACAIKMIGKFIPEVVFTAAQDLRLGLMLDRWVIAHCLPILRQRSAHWV